MLVILAILAAIMIPQLVGYIDKARNKQYKLDARNVQIAAQTILNEKYADPKVAGKEYTFQDGSADEQAILKLAELEGRVDIKDITTEDESYKITEMEIEIGSEKKSATFKNGTWKIDGEDDEEAEEPPKESPGE